MTVVNDPRSPATDGDPRTVSGTAWALSSNKRYNVNRLVDLLGEEDVSKPAVIEVLTAHKDRLNVRQLLGQIYFLQPSEKAAVFKLIDDVANEEMIPDLLQRMDGKDPIVKMHLINVIARFDHPDVNKALQEQLRDANKLVRQAALVGISRSKTKIEVQLVANLLLDPDLDVMNKAIDVIVQLNHPETAKYLFPALKSENEFSRRAAVKHFVMGVGEKHVVLETLPSYAPDLNPVEWLWKHLKHVELRNRTCMDLEELHMEFHISVGHIRPKPRLIHSFFQGPGLATNKT